MAGPNGKETAVESHRQREEEELAANVLASLIDQPAQLAALAARVLSLIDDGATARATITVRLLEDYRENPERLELAAALEVFPLLEHPQPGALSLVAPLLDRTRRLKRKGARSRLQLHAADPAISDADFAALARNALPEIETEDVGASLSERFWLGPLGRPAIIDSAALIMETPPRAHLFEGLLPEGSITLFVGPPKVGKSAFCQTLALAAAEGSKALNTFQALGERFVMVVGTDQPRVETAERWRRAEKHVSEEAMHRVHHWLLPSFSLADKADIDRLLSWSKWAREASGRAPLVIVDTLRAALPLEVSENSSEVGPLISSLRPISELGASLILVHHSGHAGEGRSDAQAGRGSTAIPAAVDDLWVARPIAEGWFTLSFNAMRTGEAIKSVAVKVNHEDYGVSTDDPAARQVVTMRSIVFRWLEENGEAGPAEIAKALSEKLQKTVHRNQVGKALSGLESEKRVTKNGKGAYSPVLKTVIPLVSSVTPPTTECVSDWHDKD